MSNDTLSNSANKSVNTCNSNININVADGNNNNSSRTCSNDDDDNLNDLLFDMLQCAHIKVDDNERDKSAMASVNVNNNNTIKEDQTTK